LGWRLNVFVWLQLRIGYWPSPCHLFLYLLASSCLKGALFP
jgi:hypothetical protein